MTAALNLAALAALAAVAAIATGGCPVPQPSPHAKIPKRSGATKPTSISELKLKNWRPKSMLRRKLTRLSKGAFPAIDVHTHLGSVKDVAATVKRMDALGVQTAINLDGGYGEKLRGELARFDRKYPGRFLTYALIDFRGIDKPDWGKRAAAQLAKDFEAGAKGLKIHKTLGLTIRFKDGRRLALDDHRLEGIWNVCARYKRPVQWHVADAAAFFQPLDHTNERWHELAEFPQWSFADRKKFPTRAQLFAERNRVIRRHRDVTFIGLHVGNWPENLAQVGKWLTEHPNFYVDIAARISELGRQPYTARRFLIKWQDRVLFGTDASFITRPIFETYYRFLETQDEYFSTKPANGQQGFWMVYGLFLPKAVLRKLYRENAKRLLAFEPYKPGGATRKPAARRAPTAGSAKKGR